MDRYSTPPSQRKRAAMVEKKDPSTGQTLYGPDGKPLMEQGFVIATRFVPVYVFDVSQTEGKELPNIVVSELSGDVKDFEGISTRLSAVSPLPIMFGSVPGTAKGYASHMEDRIVVKPDMSQVQTLKTMIHEVAHGKLHVPDFLADHPKQRHEKEVEAESVAYVVCQHFGIDTSDYSFGYVAGWSRGRELSELKASLDIIHTTAAEIIDAITVYNTRIGGLTIVKKDEQTSERIPNVQMEVRKLNGEIIGTFTTDSNGMIQLPQAEKGWYEVVELKAAAGYRLDSTPHRIEVKDGQQAVLEVTNRKAGSALVHKVDSLTGEGIFGVTFLASDAKGNPIGTYQSDNEGYVFIDKELADGKYTIREIECADGYILDTQPKTFYVQYGGCTTITWPNTAVRGQIQIVKKSADYNPTNGLPAGTPLAGATFEIYNERNGNKVDTIVTDRNGLASSKTLPLGRYTIKETKAPANYGATNDTYTAVLEHSGQIVKLEITNKSVVTGVSIEKTGPKEAMRGQPVRYVFSGIGNTSNVTLQSFYWRDTLPAEVKLGKIVTGTYNFPGTYKIVYKVNNTGDYLTLADNLSTSKNYTLAASPVALGLASNQRVTEIMFVFGQAPGGFSQVEQPMIYCTALSNLAPGSSFVNVADVGGTYNGVWLQAVTRWVTNVYGKPVVPTLPKTGY